MCETAADLLLTWPGGEKSRDKSSGELRAAQDGEPSVRRRAIC